MCFLSNSIQFVGYNPASPRVSPTYNSATNRYTGTPTYDANGHLTWDGTHSYAWDSEGKLYQLDGGGEEGVSLN